MSYEVLARRLRPSGFDALVGQDHVVRALRHALDHDRLHHAYLFTGTRGVGKTTIARILAKALNCEEGVSADPCGKCSVCQEVSENRFIDLIEVDAASRTGVDDTRELLENAQYMPTRGRYKVYLIDEVHMLSMASFNALLKTLEEPPEHVKFLLATTDPKKVPATVLSRCLQFQLKNMSRDTIVAYLQDVLQQEGVPFEPAALNIIARNAAGSMRDALSLTDQALAYGAGALQENDVIAMLGVVGDAALDGLVGALAEGNVQAMLSHVAELASNNADFEDVLKGLIEKLHALAVRDFLKTDGGILGASDAIPHGISPDAFTAEELQLYYQIALMGLRDIAIAPEPRSGFEMTMLRMFAFAPTADSNIPPRSEPNATDDTEQIAATVSSQDVAPKAELHERWFALVENSQLNGVTRMIVDNCILRQLELPLVALLLDEHHDTLLSESQEKQISRWLGSTLGAPIELSIKVGAPTGETPAARKARESRERQAAAEFAMQQDAKVADLVSEFGGRIEEVRPLN